MKKEFNENSSKLLENEKVWSVERFVWCQRSCCFEKVKKKVFVLFSFVAALL